MNEIGPNSVTLTALPAYASPDSSNKPATLWITLGPDATNDTPKGYT